jgi:23S rRNA U2552 (ribose-2'-O)-methylase RlmE/FtsJ
MWRGYKHRQLEFKSDSQSAALSFPTQTNPLFKYFSEHRQGRGIYKFDHYFERYEQHFSKFRGKEVHVLEVGIFSGGSLEMWRNYFGPSCKVYGVDIDPRCKSYESDSVRVLTGDQSDKSFWRRVRQEVPAVDIVIDDGGHTAEQQIVSLEELLPHLRPGGVYVCEDVHEPFSEFAAYVCGLAQDLNSAELEYNFQDNERYSVSRTNSLQSAIAGIHFYPFMAVIERTAAPVFELIAPKRGSQWLP